jgi:hypothetical protein
MSEIAYVEQLSLSTCSSRTFQTVDNPLCVPSKVTILILRNVFHLCLKLRSGFDGWSEHLTA